MTPNELAERINSTTLSEAIEIFEEKILMMSLKNYDDNQYRQGVVACIVIIDDLLIYLS